MLAFCAMVAVGVLLAPEAAYAWGPLTHLAHGSQVLADLTIASAALQGILRAHWREYLYGCLGADITQAKKYARAVQLHCHSWNVAWKITARAQSDAQRAFAYGYLSHLAGDVYSHNHFVPTQLIVSYRARALRHVYWEARFDSLQDPALRRLLADIAAHRFPECDRLVEEVVARTLFSFRTNKRIFDSMLAWQQLDRWHSVLLIAARHSRYPLPPEVVPAYNRLCVQSIRDLLRRGRDSASQREDPTGAAALALAKDVRRKLKALARRQKLSRQIEREVAALALRPEAIAA